MDDEEAWLVVYAQSASPDGHFYNDNNSGGEYAKRIAIQEKTI